MTTEGDRAKRMSRQPAEIACTGKVTFITREQAEAVAGRNARTRKPGRGAYRCPHCKKWHLGTDVNRKRRHMAAQRFKERADE